MYVSEFVILGQPLSEGEQIIIQSQDWHYTVNPQHTKTTNHRDLDMFDSRFPKQNYKTWGIISHTYAIQAVLDTLDGACPMRPTTQSSLGMLRSNGS